MSFCSILHKNSIINTKIERIPPFEKGGPGGISEPIHLKNPPQSPFSKGGSIIFIYAVIEFKKDTKNTYLDS
jgi:hypothetical protein